MIAKLIDELAASPPPEIAALINLLGLATQPQPYTKLVNEELKIFSNFEARQTLLVKGHFDSRDFMQLLFATGGGKGTRINILMPLVRRLIEWGLVLDHDLFGNDALFKYQWNAPRIAMFIKMRILDNILLGQTYVAKKYRPSVPALFVEKDGNQSIGTAFVATNRGDASKFVLVTAKHNVDPSESIKVLGFSEPEGMKYTARASEWVLHPTLDIALMPVDCSEPPVPIFPVGSPSVLSRTITFGYPRIATTDSPYVLAHGGELNALVRTYHGEDRLIISNVVAPGNSGGPVIDEAGLCMGIIVNSFETKHEGGTEKANSAIPANHILDFIAPYCS